MSYTELYMQTTGNDLNAGSTNADAASVTSTNGSWDITADSFIATGGTPFAAVNVGDYASIYLDAATSAVYVSQVTAILSSGLGITLSTTSKYGTKPASGSTGRSAKIGGAWASLAVVTSLFASVAVPFATRVNIKAGTYANGTTSRTFGSAGLTTGPLWWRGYKTTIGDMDTAETVARVDGTDIPLFTWTTTGRCTASGNHQVLSACSFLGAPSNYVITCSGNNVTFIRCRVETTSTDAVSAKVLQAAGTGNVAIQCFFKAPSTTVRVVQQDGAGFRMLGCVITGGALGFYLDAGNAFDMAHCVFRSIGGEGVSFTNSVGGHFTIVNCTFYACTNSGIYFSGTIPTSVLITGCLFASNTGYGINNNSGTNTNLVRRYANSFFGNTVGQENGMGDSPTFFDQTESSSALTGATDMRLVAGALAISNALPGLFENETYQSYLDIGAVQKIPAVSGGSIAHSLIVGGA